MDHHKLLELKKLGLVDKSQDWHSWMRDGICITIGHIDFLAKPIREKISYQLKKINSNKYLIRNSRQLELITYQTNANFLEMSSFYLIYDDLLCSIIPCSDPNLLVCYLNGNIYLKKYLACLLDEIVTVFYLDFRTSTQVAPEQNKDTNDKKETKGLEKMETKHLVPFSQLNMLDAKNFQWLGIVAPQINNIPNYLQERVYQDKILSHYQGSESLLYLKYIITHYHQLPDKVCFLRTIPISYYINETRQVTMKLEDFILDHPENKNILDLRINLDGDRIRYRNRETNQWSKWYNHQTGNPSKITQRLFWSHIIKVAPGESYLEYASSNNRLVSREQIKKYHLDFYKTLYEKYIKSRTYSLNYLDRAWDTLFHLK